MFLFFNVLTGAIQGGLVLQFKGMLFQFEGFSVFLSCPARDAPITLAKCTVSWVGANKRDCDRSTCRARQDDPM